MTKPILTAALGVALAAAVPAMAQDKSGTNAMAGAEMVPGAVAQAALAQDLFAYATGEGDAMAALVAARIAASLVAEEKDLAPDQKPTEGAEVAADTADASDAPVEAADMFAAARELADGDDLLLGLIEDAEVEQGRGRMGGLLKHLSRLPAGYTDYYEIPFYGGRFAEIAVVGDGDADLDLLVTDENGNTICLDRSFSDKLYCPFTPAWNGYFYIAVENVGRMRNSYYLLTN